MSAPLLLAGHGTRDQAGVAAFTALTARVGALLRGEGVEVAGGNIELSAPPLRAAVAGLAARGHRQVVAVPLVLSAAAHAKGDIPAALARERRRHPGLAWRYGRPLGPHPALLELLAARVNAVLARGDDPPSPPRGIARGDDPRGIARGDCENVDGPDASDGTTEQAAVLLVARGSTDPDANAEVCKTSRLLWEGRRLMFTETAFVSLARPSVAEGLERCRRLGARRIVVARYFLFPGVLPERVAEQACRYADTHPDIDIRCSGVLGDCDPIANLVAERYREALSGDIRMNCDVCIYRTALPGFEHRVGAPQRPHDHPHDHFPDGGHVHVR